jgi:hypothetical protein
MKFQPTIQPAAPPAPSPTENQPREAASIWMAGVIAPLAQNAIGGIGTAVLGAALICPALWPGDAEMIAKVSAIAGATVFGLACMIRAFRDEISIIVSAYAAGSLDATTEALRAENVQLLAEIERLKSEGMVAHSWGAREAAERMVRDYYVAVVANVRDMDKILSRAAAMERGMTRAEWEAGVKTLQNAGILERGSRGGIWTAGSEEAALAALARHAAVSRVRIRAANGDMASL